MPIGETHFYRVQVSRIVDLTPSFRRFTFTGEDLSFYGDPGFDQRIKVVFPTETVGLDALPQGPDWYLRLRELPSEKRLPFRTYTTRAVRNDDREVDVDMVVHPVLGPASAWIESAVPGDEVILIAPTTARTGVSLGVDFVPPAAVDNLLLAGDETAAPAIAAILEQVGPDARGTVVVELPHPEDLAYLPEHPGFRRVIADRSASPRHTHLLAAVRAEARALCPPGRGREVEEVDIDQDILWEVPRAARGGAALQSAPLYAWLAGESGAIKDLRRFLVSEHGVDRRAVAFMGYWRQGRAENA